jgi:POT family proton-dependent oligopeptide transporter
MRRMRPAGSAFMGHPKGLFYLAFTEAWERFSYYGMTALVVLYMVNQLLLPGHVEHIAGFAGFRAAVESVVGPLSTQALASQIFGLYSGFVYFTPLLGGLIADRWIGQRNAVVIGALSMSGGHLAMAFEQSFLLALVLLVVGSGFLKGNISSQVGALYPRDDEARRTRGFAIFSTGINFGAVVGPLLCGLLAQVYGWHYGFGIAAVFMLAGAARIFSATATCPHAWRDARGRQQTHCRRLARHPGARRGDHRSFSRSLTTSSPTSCRCGYSSTLRSGRPSDHSDPWYQSIDPLFSILGVPLLFWIWRQRASRKGSPVVCEDRNRGLLAAASNRPRGAIAGAGGARIHRSGRSSTARGRNRLPVLLAHIARARRGRRPRG